MKKLFLIVLFSFSAWSFTGGDKGNGGLSVVCRDSSGVITSAELLDIYEGRLIHKLSYDYLSPDIEGYINFAKAKIADQESYVKRLTSEIDKVHRNLIFIPYGNELEEIDDAIPVIRKKNCKFEQLANYTPAGLVLVSEEIFDHLDHLNRAALILHEAIYAIRRARGEINSQTARELTAHLMAKSVDVSKIERLIKGDRKTLCGLNGTVLDRIMDCMSVPGELFPNYVMISRNRQQQEYYLESLTGLIWGPKVPMALTYFEAINFCENVFKELGLRWRLPLRNEILRAEKMGIRSQLLQNDMSYYWISSGPISSEPSFYKSDDGAIDRGSAQFQLNVRCVANKN